MPYFNNKDINLLFIHIPKTGGSSIENYFSEKYNIELNPSSLYCGRIINYYNNIEFIGSYQHFTYMKLIENKDLFRINMNNLSLLTSVRNPYNKAISDLFHFNKISFDSTPEFVFTQLKHHIEENIDNHMLPQYKFLLNENDVILPNIKILKCETLTNDMIQMGYDDFNRCDLKNNMNTNYERYLMNDSIQLINEYYEKDFELFNYNMIKKT